MVLYIHGYYITWQERDKFNEEAVLDKFGPNVLVS